MTDTPANAATDEARLLRPSSLPKLAECRAYEGKPGTSPAAERGTRLDRIIRDIWSRAGKASELLAGLPAEDADAIDWALNTMEHLAEGATIETREAELAAACPVEGIRPGTMDALCVERSFLVDFKTGQIRNYREQMAAYALACMDAYFADSWTAHLLFVDQQVVITHDFTEAEARAIVEQVRDMPVAETPCEYCKWCARFGTCPKLRAGLAEVVELGTTAPKMTPHDKAGKILPPNLLDIANDDARAHAFLAAFAVAEDYVDIVRGIVRERVKAQGGKNDYFTLTQRRGKRSFPARGFDHVIGETGNMAVLQILGPAKVEDARALWKKRVRSIPFPEDLIEEAAPSTVLNRRPAKAQKLPATKPNN